MRFNYLIPIFLIPVAWFLGSYLASGVIAFRGQEWAIVFVYAMGFLGFLFWLPKNFNLNWGLIGHIFLFLLLITWIIQTIKTQLDQTTFNIVAFIVPFVILMIWLKRPTRKSFSVAFLAMLYGLAVISIGSLIFGTVGWTRDGFAVGDSGGQRLEFLAETFGITTRWGGPFASVNYAAPIGALLIVAGFTLAKPHKFFLVATGLLILSLAQARTSLVALLAGLIVLFIFSDFMSRQRLRTLISVSLVTALLVSIIVYIRAYDPSLNGRIPIWEDFWGLFISQPLGGLGSVGIGQFAEEQVALSPGSFPHTKAHSVLLDIAARYGLVLLIPSILLVALVVWVSWRRRQIDRGASLAIAIYVLVAGMADTIYSWQYVSIYTLTFIYIMGSSRITYRNHKTHSEEHYSMFKT